MILNNNQKVIITLRINEKTVENEHEDITAELTAENVNEVEVKVNEGRKRRLKAKEMEWARNKNKKLRMKGQQYLEIKKNESGKLKQNVVKTQRELKPHCSSQACKKATN